MTPSLYRLAHIPPTRHYDPEEAVRHLLDAVDQPPGPWLTIQCLDPRLASWRQGLRAAFVNQTGCEPYSCTMTGAGLFLGLARTAEVVVSMLGVPLSDGQLAGVYLQDHTTCGGYNRELGDGVVLSLVDELEGHGRLLTAGVANLAQARAATGQPVPVAASIYGLHEARPSTALFRVLVPRSAN